MSRYPPRRGPTTSAVLLVIRLVAGSAFIIHGWPKIQKPFSWMGPEASMPGFLQALAAVSEFFGGMAWVAGLLTPIASFGILCTMAVAASIHFLRGDPFVGRGGSYELALVYLVIALLLMLLGPGRASLDAMIFGRGRAGEGGGPGESAP